MSYDFYGTYIGLVIAGILLIYILIYHIANYIKKKPKEDSA
ncbi:hypothetical protein LCGC14_1678890 [marine sediment metagenome]|uniref:Uncharacterized protein n=1 Tax=marine sediment metagenome TaxID=412755 RepID=A0A0F9K4Z1_9ZZZZ